MHAFLHSSIQQCHSSLCVCAGSTHREKAWLLPIRKLTAEKKRVTYVNEIIPLSFSHCFPAEEGKAMSVFSRQQEDQDRHHKGGDTSEVSPASLSHVSLTDKCGENTWVLEPQEQRHRCKIQRARLFGYQAATGMWKACSPSAKDVYIFLYPYYFNLLKTIQSTSVFKI